MVPMRDGVKLATDVYRPEDVTGPMPVILMRTPYNKQGRAGAALSNPALTTQDFTLALTDADGNEGVVAAANQRYGNALHQTTGNISARVHVILDQVRNGVALRMAVLYLFAGRAPRQRGGQTS